MEKKKSFRARLAKNIQKNWILYVMMLPVVIYYIVFAYAPMYGVQLAFKNYKIKLGIMAGSIIRFVRSLETSPAIRSR